MKLSKFPLIVLVASIAASAQFSFAESVDFEKESLAGIRHELEYIKGLVATAKTEAPSGTKYNFRYGDFENDLDAMIGGIDEYLSKPSSVPRTVEPLHQEYVQ